MKIRQPRLYLLVTFLGLLSGITSCQTAKKGHLESSPPQPIVRKVADRVLADFPQPPVFNWGEGVLMAGMMRAGVVLHEPRYVEFVRTWADHWRAEGIDQLLEKDPKGYCGRWGPGYALVLLYENTKDPAYLEMSRKIADYILTQATRTREGGLAHWEGNHQLWVDTLYMSVPVLVNLARVDARPELLHEAAHQLVVSSNHLQDAHTGLFYHMYDEPSDRRTDVLWGRGNGWVALSYLELLPRLDRRSPEFTRINRDFRNQLQGLMSTQDDQTGLWHTVLDRKDSYLETSASAMILWSLTKAERFGLLRGHTDRLEKAWRGLTGKVDDAGHVVGVSGGTSPAKYEVYVRKDTGIYTWGTGAFLLAASALCENCNEDNRGH